MRIDHGLEAAEPGADGPPTWVTIGNFDGVHRGHRDVLARLLERAGAAGGDTGVVTFDPHPRCVLRPDQCPPTVTTTAEKAWLLEDLGIDRLVILHFDEPMSHWPAAEFCRRMLASMRLRGLVVGRGFALGHRRLGDVAFLRSWGADHGVEVEAVSPLRDAGGVVSSTRVRDALISGEMVRVAELLGRPWFIDGHVVGAPGPGRAPAGPVVRLRVRPGKALPAAGTYACRLSAGKEGAVAAVSIPRRARPHEAVELLLRLAGAPAIALDEVVRCEVVRRLPVDAAHQQPRQPRGATERAPGSGELVVARRLLNGVPPGG